MSLNDDKENPNPDPTQSQAVEATSTAMIGKGKSKLPSASTKTVWKSYDDAVLVATLLKEREDGIVATGENVFRAGMTDTVDSALALFDNSVDSDEDNDNTDEDAANDWESPIKRSNRKRSADEMSPFPTSSQKHQASGRSIRRSGSGRASGPDAMFSVAGAIGTLIDKFEEPEPGLGLTSPERRRAAIHRLEDDDDLSETEQVAAVKLFSRKTSIADSYLAIKKKSTRTLYIQSEIADVSAF